MSIVSVSSSRLSFQCSQRASFVALSRSVIANSFELRHIPLRCPHECHVLRTESSNVCCSACSSTVTVATAQCSCRVECVERRSHTVHADTECTRHHPAHAAVGMIQSSDQSMLVRHANGASLSPSLTLLTCLSDADHMRAG